MTKPIPRGISDFKKLIDDNYTYVDKTLLIQEIIEKKAEVALIPRPRRFGKTLNLSMIRYFFEKGKEDTSYLFKDLNIWKKEEYRAMQGQFPVIFISFKDAKSLSWQENFEVIQELISIEFKRHRYLMEGDFLFPDEKDYYMKIVRKETTAASLGLSLFLLSECLHRYHKKRVIILIDEYDSPAHAAYIGKYYDTMIAFLRTWLSAGLKDNSYLEWGVLTGVLRLAKESIFSGLNNISTFTILNENFQDKFGLLESEVITLLKEYGLESKLPEIKEWYDGYRMGSCPDIYNPWSVLNCIEEKGSLVSYWGNTSDNAIINQLFTKGNSGLKKDLEELLKGGVIEKTIEEGAVFAELENNPESIWSLLLFSGYLTLDVNASSKASYFLRIPNREVSSLYQSMILGWFKSRVYEDQYQVLLNSLTTGNIKTFGEIFEKFLPMF